MQVITRAKDVLKWHRQGLDNADVCFIVTSVIEFLMWEALSAVSTARTSTILASYKNAVVQRSCIEFAFI